ncbi:GNAT family N-acetyltransferase [Nocardioides sp.]|uniref:GNAT family N-acetyltransferase n=1 Tax=Nocardioides sp. TaxID=35761 RepID=UPI002733B17A|nr:GNAT family N-acetyltransferase [Nocardioides sp.]MDP3891712.1 GNAT family N-acetyltransferase [Nocardioides sp.]
MEPTWTDRSPDQLSLAELHEILALRNRVFVVEQECPYQDIDGLDLDHATRHLWAAVDNEIHAYARLRAPDATTGRARIGRVIVAAAGRGQQLGRRLMERALAACADHWPDADVTVAAQAHLQGFYASLGFVAEGEGYDEDGIPHQDMTLTRA